MKISISREGFSSKPSFPPPFNHRNYDINAEVSPEQLCQLLAEGHILAPPVKDNVERNGKVERNAANVLGREYVMVDIESDDHEKIPEITPDTFSAYTGGLAPTFVYASYSDGVKGHRYHFVWCFDEFIADARQNLDIWSRCRAIAREIVGERYEDDESVKDLARLCYGSYGKAAFSTCGYKTYLLSDFENVTPMLSEKQRKTVAGTKSKAGKGRRNVSTGIYVKGDHFGYERRQDVIFTLYYFWKDTAKVREIYESIDPNRTDPAEGESLMESAYNYARQGNLHPTAEGVRICTELGVLPKRNDFAKELEYDDELTVTRHLSEKKDEIIATLGKISLIVSEPGAGKTVFSQNLPGNVLVVQMLTSIVDSAKFPKGWVKVYDQKRFPNLWWKPKEEPQTEKDRDLFSAEHDAEQQETGPKAGQDKPLHIVCTIDKMLQLTHRQLETFDYIVVDESHILFESSEYRRIGLAIPLLNGLSQSDWNGKIVLMTGTPILEKKYFAGLRVIKVNTCRDFSHTCTIHRCKYPETVLMNFIMESIKEGRKILFPTHRSSSWTRLKNKIRKYHPDVNLGAQDFSRPLHAEIENVTIRNKSEVPEGTNVLRCTAYLSVGLDIFDSKEWSVVMLDEWVAPQIVQFANRLRERNLSIHCFMPDRKRTPGKVAYAKEKEMENRLKAVNAIGVTDGVMDLIRDKGLLKDFPYIVWNDKAQHFVADETLTGVFLDWADYRDYHCGADAVSADLEKYGYMVQGVKDNDRPKDEKEGITEDVKRHAAMTPDENELMALSITTMLAARPDFGERKDVELVDGRVKGHYVTNIRPLLLALFKEFYDSETDVYAKLEGRREKAFAKVRWIVGHFLEYPYDVRLGRDKAILKHSTLRTFVESRKLVAHIGSFAQAFQDFYAALVAFVGSKDTFTKEDVDRFIAGQTDVYSEGQDGREKEKVRKAVKSYFGIFAEKGKARQTYDNYDRKRVFALALRAESIQDEEAPF